MEKLTQQIKSKKRSNFIKIPDYDRLKTELKLFTLTLKPHKQKNVIGKQQRDLLTKLKNTKDVTIKKTEKSGHVVIMNTTDYEHKINNILSETTKFKNQDQERPN